MACYFYIKEGVIKALCLTCGQTFSDDKWFWPADLGENEIKCSICSKIINNDKKNSTSV